MPFDNFFEETDKRDVRFGLIVLAVAVAVVLAVFSYNYLTDSAIKYHTPPLANILEPQQFLKASELCNALPKPENFERVATREPQFSGSSANVFHGYRSERDFEELLPTFLVWFDANGWKRIADYDFQPPVAKNRHLIFSKGNSTVTIVHYYPNPYADARSANYELGCYYDDYSYALSH
jgi:hypothetical protein